MKPTPEQFEAVEHFRTGGSLKINAFAGSGKTTTLQLLAQATCKRGMYLAFNKSIANDAKARFPSNVSCSTVHSIAFRSTPGAFKHSDKMTGSLNANALVKQLEIGDAIISDLRISARSQGHLVLETLRRFMQGPRQQPEEGDVPLLGRMAVLEPDAQDALRATAVKRSREIWSRMRNAANPLPLGHDGYLKLWALSRPRLAADFVLLDEAQDTNPVVLDVLRHQRAQIIYVGDRHQQIYEWRGAVNAMELIDTAHTSHLTTSFRFGDQIAGAANQVLRRLGEVRPIQGNAGKRSFIGSDHCDAILARTNSSVMASVISELAKGRTPHIIGGTAEIIRMLRGVQDLKHDQPSDVSEFFGFGNWEEVVEFANSPEGEQLKTFVSLVEQYGEKTLIAKLNQTAQDERDADIVVSTAHKAKGREWETVELVDDFLRSRPRDNVHDQPELDPAEVRLFYVAMTRATTAIEISRALLGQFGIGYGPPYKNPKAPPTRRVAAIAQPKIHRAPPKASAPRHPLERWWWILPAAAAAYYLFG